MSQADVIIHFAAQSRDGAAPHKCGEMEGFGTTTKRNVTCEDCLGQLAGGDQATPSAPQILPIHLVRASTPGTYRCGSKYGLGADEIELVQCEECVDLYRIGGSGVRPPLHVPPIMNENGDGIFLFTDTHHGAGFTMEVVPQLSGNVEIAIEDKDGAGHMFTLSHLDRADMLRVLLHNFHYSPERGGPNGIDS